MTPHIRKALTAADGDLSVPADDPAASAVASQDCSVKMPMPESDVGIEIRPAQGPPRQTTPATGGWKAVGAAEIGAAHLLSGLPCQDALAYCSVEADGGEWLIAALADGAGSAEHSELGARTAVRCAVEFLRTALQAGPPQDDEMWRKLLDATFSAAQGEVLALAEGDLIAGRAFAATLICIVLGESFLAAAALGDGVIVAWEDGGDLYSVARPQRGEYANETVFLTQVDALERTAVVVEHRPLRALALLSDGLMRLALDIPEHRPYRPFFEPLFAFVESTGEIREDNGADSAVEQLRRFLASERVNARTDDDKTLLLAVRR